MEQLTLDVRLLGGFHITLNGQTIPCLTQSRQQSLLAYLMLHAGSPQSRQQLAFCFWPDCSEERAFGNLRFTLHHMRRACPQLQPYLEITQSSLQWRPLPSFRLDVADYEALLKGADERTGTAQVSDLLMQAAGLYQGELLPDCYEEWIIPERERLNQSYLQVLHRLVDALAAQHHYQSAIAFAIQLRNADPLGEFAYRRLMELHEEMGDRSAALRVYHECLAMLTRELGVEPAPKTRALYERIVNPAAAPRAPLHSPPVIIDVAGESFVGRQEEWQQLQMLWQKAREGQPHLVLIQGVAGIGKTRLAEQLLVWASQQEHPTVHTRAYAAEGPLAYAPLVGWLRTQLYRDKVRALDTVWLVELSRLLPELISENPDLPRPTPLTDSWQRQRLFEALAHAALSVGTPLLVLIDDLQWADQETLEWLHFLLRFNPSAALLVVATARMEEVDAAHPLSALLTHLRRAQQVSEIELSGLDAEASAELAQQIANRRLDAEVLADLYTYAEGVPLFLVEAVRAEAGKGSEENWRWRTVRAVESMPVHAAVSIPPRVYAVLQARLNQLSPQARLLADLAAVIGRSFAVDLLVAASGTDEAVLIRGLDELWKRRIIRERGVDYEISHDRIRDVAYAEISPMQRRLLHRRVAQAFEAANAINLDAVSAQLAWHYQHAGAPKRAIDFYQQAGMAAQRIYANNQAVDLLNKGISLLEELPAAPERDRQELALQTAMAASLRTKNYLSSELNHALNRALELSRKVDDAKHHYWPLFGLHLYHQIRGELGPACELVQSLLAIAEQEQEPQFLITAHAMAGGNAFFFGGDALAAQAFFSKTSMIYTAKLHEEQVLLTGFDHGIHVQAWSAHSLWYLGYGEQALHKGIAAVERAKEIAHPFSQVLALAYLAMFHQFRRENEAVQVCAESALALATRHEVGYYGAWAAILAAWALASTHPGPTEIAGLQKALRDFRTPGSGLRWPYYLSLLADVYSKAGEDALALATIDEALGVVDAYGEHWWEAELHRLRGEILLSQGAALQLVEGEFQRGLAIARQQKAVALELRAATSLARLCRQSQREQDYQILSTVYCQFSEGLDTLDLQEAKSLLAELPSIVRLR